MLLPLPAERTKRGTESGTRGEGQPIRDRTGAKPKRTTREPPNNERQGEGACKSLQHTRAETAAPYHAQNCKIQKGDRPGRGILFIGDLTRRRSDPAQLLPICHPVKRQEATERTGRGSPPAAKIKNLPQYSEICRQTRGTCRQNDRK